MAIAVILQGKKSLRPPGAELGFYPTRGSKCRQKNSCNFFPKGVEFERFFGDTRDPLEYFCEEIIW